MNVAQTTRACSSSSTIKREGTRRESLNLGIWNMVGSRIQKARGNYYHERDARTNLRGRENGDGGKGKREGKRAERWRNGQVLLNENNSPLSSRREESVSPGHEGDTRGGSSTDPHTHTASEENEDKRRPRGMQVGAKLT